MSNDIKTYACGTCGSSGDLSILVEAVNFAIINSDGEWNGETILGDGKTIGIACGSCDWSMPCDTREEGLALLKTKPAEDTPSLWDHPLLHDWQSEVSAGDTLRSFAEYVVYQAELDAEDQA